MLLIVFVPYKASEGFVYLSSPSEKKKIADQKPRCPDYGYLCFACTIELSLKKSKKKKILENTFLASLNHLDIKLF